MIVTPNGIILAQEDDSPGKAVGNHVVDPVDGAAFGPHDDIVSRRAWRSDRPLGSRRLPGGAPGHRAEDAPAGGVPHGDERRVLGMARVVVSRIVKTSWLSSPGLMVKTMLRLDNTPTWPMLPYMKSPLKGPTRTSPLSRHPQGP